MTQKTLKAARLSDSSLGTSIDNALGEVEDAIAAALGLTLDVPFTVPLNLGGLASGINFDHAGISNSSNISATDVNAASPTPVYFDKKRTLTAGALSTVGKICRVRAYGVVNDSSAPGEQYNFFPALFLGGTEICAPNANGLHVFASSFSSGRWELDAEIVTRVAGASGTICVDGKIITSTPNQASVGVSLNGLGPTFTKDLTAALDVQIGLTAFGINSASKIANLRQLTVEIGLAGHAA